MSWNISQRGTKEKVAQYLDEQAPTALAHVQGVERALADQALGLARAAVAGTTNEMYEVSASATGSASFTGDGSNQDAQAISVVVQFMRKA